MQLMALDSEFVLIGYLPYINLQWNREYYEAGQFSVQIRAADYNPNMKYLYTPDRPEMGIIQKPDFSSNIKGKFLQLSGFFMEKRLDDKIVFPTYYGTGKLDKSVIDMVIAYKDDIPKLVIAEQEGTGESLRWQETGGGLGETAYTRLQTQEKSLRCRYDYLSDKILFEVWQGRDLTQDQTENNFVTFSTGFRNLSNVKASVDDSNKKNYAIVAGSGEGENRISVIVDLSNGGYRKQVYIDARDQQYNPEEQTEAEYRERLRQHGITKLTGFDVVKNIEVTVKEESFVYLKDFDLGDKVDVIIDEIGLDMTARIVSVHEVHKQNQMTVTIELGDKQLTQLKKARLK